MSKNKIDQFREKFNNNADSLGNLFVEVFHYLALFAVGAIIAWAALQEFLGIFANKKPLIDGILMLFIYLELGAMVGIYFKTKRMPVRFLIYVSITALTRLLISHISHNHQPNWGIIQVCGAILLLAIAVLIVRIASSRFHVKEEDESR
ncbi:phosphate-starvation-inducible protein PsiE [Entomomonas asaccharolytica]|uniref:Protein PsiE n=1 Tax=Entomomonas asaccharolytica TaxID=2785331 RepID=A0A974NFJ4_9GAMM|nr:phosphate-starvation-inducible PsiE family protein [Entomomonas asaccharolytica]